MNATINTMPEIDNGSHQVPGMCYVPWQTFGKSCSYFTHRVSLLILSCVLLYNKYTHNANETYHTVYADQKGKRNP